MQKQLEARHLAQPALVVRSRRLRERRVDAARRKLLRELDARGATLVPRRRSEAQRALADARERGCTTTTLVATKMGHPVYARLGYRDLGRVQMWERRKPDPAAA